MKIDTCYELTNREIADLFTGAFECNDMVTAWCRRAKCTTTREIPDSNLVNYAQPEFYDGDWRITIYHDDPGWPEGNGQACITLDEAKVKAGLELMVKNHQSHWADHLLEQDDAITYDVFLQCCVFGEVVYG